MREKDQLDLLLDSALSTYADPRAGLEDRVLSALDAARLVEENRAPQPAENSPAMENEAFRARPLSFQYIRLKDNIALSRRRLAWAIALPVAACLLLLWHSTSKTIHAPSTHPQQAHQTNPSPAIPLPAVPQLPTHPSRPHATRVFQSVPMPTNAQVADALPPPKLDVFPTPQPMSAEERALSLVAAQTPLPLREALVDAQQDDAPIHIALTHIPPLESPDQNRP